MSTTLTISQLRATLGWTYESSTTFGTNTSNASSFSYNKTLAQGTGSGNANKFYATTATLVGAATVSVDLAGSLTDLYGNTISFTKVKGIYLEHTNDTTATSIQLGGAAANAFINWVGDATDTITIRNGGVFLLACTDATGYAVTAGTGDLLKILNNDGTNTATYKLAIFGE